MADYYGLLDHWFWGRVCSFGRTLEEVVAFGCKEYEPVGDIIDT